MQAEAPSRGSLKPGPSASPRPRRWSPPHRCRPPPGPRAGERAHLSPTSAVHARRVLRKRPPPPCWLPPRRGVTSDVSLTSATPASGGRGSRARARVCLLGGCRRRWKINPMCNGAAEPGGAVGWTRCPVHWLRSSLGCAGRGGLWASLLDARRSRPRLSLGRWRWSRAVTLPAAALRSSRHPSPLSGPCYWSAFANAGQLLLR